MSDNLARALRPVVIELPLKAGVQFSVEQGELIRVHLASTFDFDVTLTVDNYGTLDKLIEVLTEAQEAELERIKASSAAARGERTRKQSAVRPTISERNRKRRRRSVK